MQRNLKSMACARQAVALASPEMMKDSIVIDVGSAQMNCLDDARGIVADFPSKSAIHPSEVDSVESFDAAVIQAIKRLPQGAPWPSNVGLTQAR